MAIQAQKYPTNSGFPLLIPPEWGGDGGGGGAVGLHDEMWLNPQRQQFHTQNPRSTRFLNHAVETETPSFWPSQRFFESRIEKESLNIDQLMLSQNERLRLVLREQRKRDVVEMLKKFEKRMSFLMKQKDEEMAKASTRTSQLESLLVKLQTESMTWQQIARQNEVHVISLSNTIQQLQQSPALHGGEVLNHNEAAVEDAESCCDEQQSGFNGGHGLVKMVCRVCERRVVAVVVLPCRHLCFCTVCDPMIDVCPVCKTEKKASTEALFHFH